MVVDAAGEEDVAAGVVLADAGGPLEAGVVDGAGIGEVAVGVFFVAGQAEVEQLGVAVAGDDDVGHLEVAVRDALLEGVVEARHHVGGDARGVERGELAADLVEVAQVLAFDEVHDDVVERPLGDDFVDGDDVGVLELGAQLAFAAEELALVVGAGAAVAAAQHLDGEQLAGVLVRGAEHAGEGAGADAVLHLVVAVEEAGAIVFDAAGRAGSWSAARGGRAPA